MKKIIKTIAGIGLSSSLVCGADIYMTNNTNVPNISMKNTALSFTDIQGYQNYNIVATHFRTDKNEIRYILANPVAYNALRSGQKIMPNGSKIVKIGYSVKKMSLWTSALEADTIQRVEFMIKDVTKHKESDGWGYARFVKSKGQYKAWSGDIKSCVACHASASENDFLFTTFQKML